MQIFISSVRHTLITVLQLYCFTLYVACIKNAWLVHSLWLTHMKIDPAKFLYLKPQKTEFFYRRDNPLIGFYLLLLDFDMKMTASATQLFTNLKDASSSCH